jgi:class 3 adenylate cyclase
MESHGVAGRIQMTEATRRLLGDRYRLEDRGEVEVKGKGRLRAYLLSEDPDE